MLKFSIIVGTLVIFSIPVANCQSLSLPAESYKNNFGSAVSAGVFLDKEAVFWGFGVDYSRLFKERWIINFSLAYDQEHSNTEMGGQSVINTVTPSIALGYSIKPNFAIGVGLGKGLFDDDNEKRKIQYNKNGGWTVGLIGVYTLYQKGQHGFDIAAGIERGLTNPETDITVELGYGFSF